MHSFRSHHSGALDALAMPLLVQPSGNADVALMSAHGPVYAIVQLTELAKFTDHLNPAVTRILFTPNDMLAREYIKSLMRDAELEVR